MNGNTSTKKGIAPQPRKSQAAENTYPAFAMGEGKMSMVGKVLLGLVKLGWFAIAIVALYYAGLEAYDIRLYAIKTYGLVIHEFDPWFNFRATQYLADHGLYNFFHWFDYKVWYPLGRPVGTTIFPGMQIAAVAIWNFLNDVVGYTITLNDVCCYCPAWFGVSATFFLGFLGAECSGSWTSGIFAAAIMAIVPAHIMRSVGGGFDNESVAMTAMCMTFFCWVRALREDPRIKDGRATRDSYVFGVMSGLAFIYMAAAWGGFTFVLNLIALHAAILVPLGRYSSRLHRAYTLFYIVGIAGAMQVPVVGWGPLRSLEQLAALAVFYCLQFLEYCEIQRRKKKLGLVNLFFLRVKVFIPALGVALFGVFTLFNMGYFGPLGARIRGLFVKHTRTGNPLVDSVAEHQPGSVEMYKQYLNKVYDLAPYGLAFSAVRWTDANVFLILYSVVAYYFCSRMSRLIILLGPVASMLGGIAMGFVADHCGVYPIEHMVGSIGRLGVGGEKKEDEKDEKDKKKSKAPKARLGPMEQVGQLYDSGKQKVLSVYNNPVALLLRVAVGVYLARDAMGPAREFYNFSRRMAEGMSNPSIMFKARLQSGQEIMVDDYREAYWWLRDNTPEDSRVMAWWDYGYQITGIGNRTTIADGNTWNHEHIATLGRILSGTEKRSHRIARHLADYVLVWAGGGGDDLAKSPHMARIGNSVYHDICPGDPTCSSFGFYQGGIPTPMMANSLLYKLTQYGYKPEITLDKNRYEHVFTSKYGKCRIFAVKSVSKESKAWIADPKNRKCDAPGSWYCSGQYPPKLHKLIAKRKNFKQLEDFNTEADEEDQEYQKEYHARLSGKKAVNVPAQESAEKQLPGVQPKLVGCYAKESELGADKTYGGGTSGSYIALARKLAWGHKKKYVAIAKNTVDGHSFVFDEPPKGEPMSDAGCRQSCLDFDSFACGCADSGCGDLKPTEGEDNVRRWAVYQVPERKKKKKKDKKKKNKKKERSADDEL